MIKKNINGIEIHEWKYKNTNGDDTGYKDLNEGILKTFNCDSFIKLNEGEKIKYIDNILNIIKERNIYPKTYYYSHKDIIDEIKYCNKKILPKFDGNILDKRPTLGNSLLKFLFPNFHLIDCKGIKNNSFYARWLDNHKMWRSIEFCLNFKQNIKEPVLSYSIADGMGMIGGNTGTNYLPMKAKMLLEYYMPNGGNYLDFSCGFGGRLLGALTSNKGNITYYGFEPNSETYYHLNELKEYIKEALNIKDDRIKLYKQGSEEEIPNELKENMDFAFSCPPYFNLEQYSNEETQCYIKYPNIQDWIDNYVKNTIINLYKTLKFNAYYAVNIEDFKIGNKQIKFVDEWIKLSEENGFKYIKEIPVKIGRERPNSQSEKNIYIPKKESIYLFQKL